MLVGAPLKGRIVIVDDVLTSGVGTMPLAVYTSPDRSPSTPQKAVREAIDIVQSHPDARLVGILQLVDRQERGGKSELSTVQEIEREFGVPVVPIIEFADIIRYAEGKEEMRTEVVAMKKYLGEWGIRVV
jgi:orotate phosphoribosyltransferase